MKKAVVFFGIVLLGLLISIFTLNKCGQRVAIPDETEKAKEESSEKAEGSATEKGGNDGSRATGGKGKSAASETKAADGKNGSTQVSEGSNGDPGKSAAAVATALAKMKDPSAKVSAKALIASLASGWTAGDFDAFVKAVGEDAISPSIRERLKALIENPSLVVDPNKPFSEISKSPDSQRWAINLVPKNGVGSGEQILTDIAQAEGGSFNVERIGFPINIAGANGSGTASPGGDTAQHAGAKKSAMKSGENAGGSPAQKAGAADSPATTSSQKTAAGTAGAGAAGAGGETFTMPKGADALTIAQAFAQAVVQKNFKVARALADRQNVTDERVAALMMAVEEGKFQLREERPFVVTLSRDDITWILTRVESTSQSSEFAVELGKPGSDWLVNGLTFSKVIASLANKAGGGGVAYTPIVDNPAGGDSLVLYFEFDQSEVTGRSARQLGIVADILKQDPSKKIVISGHADAKGSDDYNTQLSDRRAASIRRSLIGAGVPAGQVITQAFGESKPRSPNFNPDGSDNPTGRSQNRRAEVYLDF